MNQQSSEKSLGQQLRRLRLDKKMSYRDLAEELSMSEATLRNWESNRAEPSVHRLDALLRLLGGKMTLGAGDGRELRYSLVDELTQMGELLHGAAQLTKAIEYRITLINNLVGKITYDVGGEDWVEIPFDYENQFYNVYGKGKKEAPAERTKRGK